jgi:hypothetical protein
MTAFRMLLRLVAVLLVAGAAYLIVLQPKANVLSTGLDSKLTLSVQCSSVMNQWRHDAKPAALDLGSVPLATVGAAQKDCASASHTIKEVGVAMVGGAVVALVLSFIFKRRIL